MAKNEFLLNVFSKFFKPIGIDSWQSSTKVTLDEPNGKLTVNFEAPQCLAPIQILQLSEFRAPKPPSKKSPPGSFVVELRGRSVFTQTRIIQFQTTNEDTYNLFFSALRRCYSNDKKNRDDKVTPTGPALATSAVIPATVSPAAEADEFINGVYATVGGVNETEEEEEFLFCDSKIYDAFDVERCFTASLDDYASSYGGSAKSLNGVCKGDEVCLYIAQKRLELLSKDAKQLLASWPFTQIKKIGVSKMAIKTVRLEFAERTCTGLATLTFRPSGGSSGERNKNFLERLVACIVTPPRPKCSCPSATGNSLGQQQKRPARRRQDTLDGGVATEDDDDDDDDDEDDVAESRRPQQATPVIESEHGVYAMVQHEKDETAASSSPPGAPALPPHPTFIAATSAAHTAEDAVIAATPVATTSEAAEAPNRKLSVKSARPPPPPLPPPSPSPSPSPSSPPQQQKQPLPASQAARRQTPPPIPQTTRPTVPPPIPPPPQLHGHQKMPPAILPKPPTAATSQPRQPQSPIDYLDDGGGYALPGDLIEDTV